jgi:hypothetical protein
LCLKGFKYVVSAKAIFRAKQAEESIEGFVVGSFKSGTAFTTK